MSYKQLLEDVDDWYLGKKTGVSNRASYSGRFRIAYGSDWYQHSASKSSGSSGFKSGTGLTNLLSASLNQPEVMIKLPRRNKVSNGLKGIQNNLDYISRNGDLALEDQDGNLFHGKTEVNELIENYRFLGIEDESRYREALNVVLSMPPGTDPVALKDAVRAFAKETFPNNRWVMVQHLDTSHPHCHLNVVMRNHYGQRINPRKQDLWEWRLKFAEKLREQGVQCTASRRQHRGKFQKSENGVLRQMKDRQAESNVYRQKTQALLDALQKNEYPSNPFLAQQLKTQNIMVNEYRYISQELYRLGYKKEAKMLSVLRKQVENADTRTNEQIAFDKAKNHRLGSLNVKNTVIASEQGERGNRLTTENHTLNQGIATNHTTGSSRNDGNLSGETTAVQNGEIKTGNLNKKDKGMDL